MNWFEKQRIAYIGDKVDSEGVLNRADIMEKFDVSVVQASKDIATFMRLNPRTIIYNRSLKRYEKNVLRKT